MVEGNNLEISNDIIECSYYAITYFQKQNKEMTNLKLQKIMYFTECYFMAVTDENKLYDCDWLAWNYGPVNLELYNKYKEFESKVIELSDDEITVGNNIPKINKLVVEGIFVIFGQLAAYQLVDLTHEEGSPWKDIFDLGGSQDEIDNVSQTIDKDLSKEWFKSRFGKYFDGKK